MADNNVFIDLSRMIRDDRIEEYRQKGLQDSLKELEDLMAEWVLLCTGPYDSIKVDC